MKKSNRQITLDKLKKGESATVIRLETDSVMRKKLLQMGLTPDCRVKLIRRLLLGGPLEFSVRGYRLCIRKSDAKKIIAEKSAQKEDTDEHT